MFLFLQILVFPTGSTIVSSETDAPGYYYNTGAESGPTATTTTEINSTPSSETTQANDIVTEINALDEDAIDIGTDKIGELGEDEAYEYYYVYYDEAGNIVNKSGKDASIPSLAAAPVQTGQNKVQEITIESPMVSDDKKPGDTPTIYAEIQEPEKHEEEANNSNDSGLSIFGIPIPRLPLNFGFGLTPAFSSGLLPLNIGRKGDALDIDGGSGTTIKKKKKPVKDKTRGPDILNPIWIETGLKAANLNLRTEKPKVQQAQKKHSQSGGDSVFQKRATKRPHQQIYSYQQPSNPVIPLRPSYSGVPEAARPQPQPQPGQEDPRYFPGENAQKPGEYFPKGYLPAIKFDHPVPMYDGPLGGGNPVLPPPGSHEENAQVKRQIHKNAFNQRVEVVRQQQQQQQQPQGSGIGSPRDNINGFRPLFRPNSQDPMFGNRPNNNGQPFQGGIQTSQRLPPGFKLSNEGVLDFPSPSPETSTTTEIPFNGPSIQFTSPRNDLHIPVNAKPVRSTPIPQVGPTFAAVPEDTFTEQSTQQAPRRPNSITPLPTDEDYFYEEEEKSLDQLPETKNVPTEKQDLEQLPLYEYEYIYEDELEPVDPQANYEQPPADSQAAKDEIQQLLEDLRRHGAISDTTERSVPTLQVEEVTTRREDLLKSTVQIAHKGTPKIDEVPEETTIGMTEQTSENPATTLKAEGPEYEYYYEYYEDEEDLAASEGKSIGTSDDLDLTPEASTPGSLQSFFNLLKGDPPKDDPSSSGPTVLLPLPVTGRPKLPTKPTQAPPVRTSTQLYDVNGNYLESQRSTVTVDTSSFGGSRVQGDPDLSRLVSTTGATVDSRRQLGRSSSARPPYPFHPDRLDPGAKKPGVDDEVKWYYNNYNSENVDPFVAPETTTTRRSSLSRGPSSGSNSLTSCCYGIVGYTLVLAAFIQRMFVI